MLQTFYPILQTLKSRFSTLELEPYSDDAGVSNQYLIASSSEAALLYNDASVNENGHAAAALRMLGRPECDLLEDLDREERLAVRHLIISIGAPRGLRVVKSEGLVLQGKNL